MHEVKFCVRINIKFQSTHESIRFNLHEQTKRHWMTFGIAVQFAVSCIVDRIILKLTKSIIDNRFDLIKQILETVILWFVSSPFQFNSQASTATKNVQDQSININV